MPTYVFDRERGIMVDKETRLPMLNQFEQSQPLQTPRVISDTPGYRSPVTGDWIEGRRARKYDLERHGCIDAGDLPSKTNGKLKNAKFAAKHGATHLLER